MKLITINQSNILDLVVSKPEMFKDYIIFEAEGNENFDIGLKEFWLKVKLSELDISVFSEKPGEEDDYILVYNKPFSLQKPKFINDGAVNEAGCYKYRIIEKLN